MNDPVSRGPIRFIDGVRVWHQGPPAGATPDVLVALLPGFGAGLEFLIPLAKRVSADCDTVVFDLPGFGQTPWASHESIDEIADTLSEILNKLSPARVVIVAQSVASVVALRMARKATSASLKGVCLLGGAQYRVLRCAERPGITLLSHPITFSFLLWTLLAAATRLPQSLRNAALRSSLARKILLWPYLSEPVASDPVALGEVLANSGSVRAFSFARLLRELDIATAVRECSSPLALLTGARDRYVNAVDRSVYRHQGHVVIDQIITGSGHWLTVEALDATADWLNGAVERLLGRNHEEG